MPDTTSVAATSSAPPTAKDAGAKAPSDFSNPNTAPSLSDLKKVKYVSTVTSVATPAEIEALGKISPLWALPPMRLVRPCGI